MKKFARCVLILIFVIIVSGACGYFYEDKTLTTMYTSTTQLYVVPGEENEATVRAVNGGLKDDFIIVFKSNVVIQEAQRIAGTSEDIASYLTVSSPANSNIVEITCTNPDQNTAKQYVDAVAKTALKTTSIIPVKSIQILSEGTSTNTPVKPDLYRNTLMIAGACGAVCAVLEIIIVLILCAFKKPEDHSDDEFEYEARFGRYAYPRREYIETEADSTKREDDNVKQSHEPQPQKKHSEPQEMKDILEDFDEDYAEEDEDVFADDALEDEDEPEEAKALQEAAITQEEAGQEPDSQMKVSQQEEKQEAAEMSEDTHPDTEEDVFADATSDDDETDDEFDGDILEGDVVEDNDSDDDVIQEDVVEEDIVEDVSDEAAAAETGTDKAKVAEVPEETAIDIYRVGQQSSSRVIARIQK